MLSAPTTISAQFGPSSPDKAEAARKALGSLSGSRDPKAVEKAARDFEAVFVTQMFQHLFSGIETDGLFGGGSGEEMFRSLMLDEYGKKVAHNGKGIGIAQSVMREMLKTQEV